MQWCSWAGGKCAHSGKMTCPSIAVKHCAALREKYRAEARLKELVEEVKENEE